MKKIRLLVLLIFIGTSLYSQDSTVYVVSGKIIDAETLKPISSVFLINVPKIIGTQTDTAGKFRILMLKSDSIRISCIGYYTKYWKPDFTKADVKNRINSVIYLTPQTYPIGAVNIYETRWKSFVYAIANTEIPEDKTQERLIKWVNTVVNGENLKDINPVSGIQIPLPIHTHYEKQLTKIKRYQEIEKLNQEAEQKFNKELVATITGLKDEELDEFMKKYCSFDRDFILKTPEYDLILIVQDIFKEYESNKK
jgi:hypothetical protein